MSTPDLTPSPPSFSSSSSTYSSPSPAAVGGARPFQPVEPCDCGTTYCRCGLQIPQCLVEVTPLSLCVCGVCVRACVSRVRCMYVVVCALTLWVSCRIMRRCAPVRSGTRSSVHCNAAAPSGRAPKRPPTSSSAPSTSSPYASPSPSSSRGTQQTARHTALITDSVVCAVPKCDGPPLRHLLWHVPELVWRGGAGLRSAAALGPGTIYHSVLRRFYRGDTHARHARHAPHTRTHDAHDTTGASKP
jgi:hypothetical protein